MGNRNFTPSLLCMGQRPDTIFVKGVRSFAPPPLAGPSFSIIHSGEDCPRCISKISAADEFCETQEITRRLEPASGSRQGSIAIDADRLRADRLRLWPGPLNKASQLSFISVRPEGFVSSKLRPLRTIASRIGDDKGAASTGIVAALEKPPAVRADCAGWGGNPIRLGMLDEIYLKSVECLVYLWRVVDSRRTQSPKAEFLPRNRRAAKTAMDHLDRMLPPASQ
jgi:hypothetical protein